MLFVGDEPGSAVPAVTASTKSTPESRSKVAKSGISGEGEDDQRPGRPVMTRQPVGNHGAVLTGRGSECGVALQSECAHRTLKIGRRSGGGTIARIRSNTVASGRARGRSWFCPAD